MLGKFSWKSDLVSMVILLTSLIAIEPIVAQDYIPPQRGIPGRREGAGTRGTCLAGTAPLIGLMPIDNFSRSLDRPTFFWFVPTTTATQGELRLLKNNRLVWQEPVTIVGGGIVAWKLSAQAPTLELEQPYRWQFSVICDPQQPSKNPFIEGTIQLTQPDRELAQQLEAAPPNQRPTLLAANGIWQDALTDLALQRCAEPNNRVAKQSWQQLLRSVQLDTLLDTPLTSSCHTISAQ